MCHWLMEAAFRSQALFMLVFATGKVYFGISTRSERGTTVIVIETISYAVSSACCR